jgi:PAS domain S-box-containing protein
MVRSVNDGSEAATARLEILAAAIQTFSQATSDPVRLLETVAQRVSEVVGDYCAVNLIAETSDELIPVALYDRDPAVLARGWAAMAEPIPLSRHVIARTVMETGQPMILPISVESMRGKTTPHYLKFVEEMGIHSAAVIPLRARGQSIGVLSLLRFRTELGLFNADEVALAFALADVAALAIASSRSSAAEQLFRGLLEGAPDAMVIVNAKGNIHLVNVEMERLFGYTRGELVGSPLQIVIPERYRERHQHQWGSYVGAPKVRTMGSDLELSGLRKDGSEFPVEIRLSPIELRGQMFVSGAIRDVSERKRLEEKTQEASRLKSEFLANMSHELRTPLNAIIGFAELMHRGKVGPMADEHHEFIGDILTSARHLLRLINDVLDVAKIESGKLEMHVETVDLGALITEVREILRGLAATKHLAIASAIEPGAATIVADPTRLKQVLYNFLSNAIKFTPDSGRIEVRVVAAGEHVRIEVEDTGIGIAEVDLPKLFIEFQQLDASTGKRYQGTGLGLALVKRVVEAHGGRVEVTSVVGKGSVFVAVIPRSVPG